MQATAAAHAGKCVATALVLLFIHGLGRSGWLGLVAVVGVCFSMPKMGHISMLFMLL
jgi:hypothetical protein